jgi:UDP-N-acetylmuramate--alanine ligase
VASFGGIHRRVEVRGTVRGVTVVDDYGHHPEEIRVTLRAAREGLGRRLLVAFQPHRFTRTRDLFNDFLDAFDDADLLFLTDIYAAGEEPIPDVSAAALARALQQRGHADVRMVPARSDLPVEIAREAREGDLVMLLGAGDIIKVGAELLAQLKRNGRRAVRRVK